MAFASLQRHGLLHCEIDAANRFIY